MIFYQNLKQELIDKLDKGIFYAEEWMVVIRVLEHEGYIAMATNLLDRLKHYKGNKYPALKDPNTIIGKMIALGKRIYEQDTLDIEQREAILKALNILEEIMRELEIPEFANEQI